MKAPKPVVTRVHSQSAGVNVTSKTAIVGIGNVLCRDEGVGVHVIEELRKLDLPDGVELHDGGTGGLDVLEILEGFDRAIIIDAVRSGMQPGEIHHFNLYEMDSAEKQPQFMSIHELDLVAARKIGKEAYEIPKDIIVIGVEPKSIEVGMDLTPTVKAAIPVVIQKILKLIDSGSNKKSKHI